MICLIEGEGGGGAFRTVDAEGQRGGLLSPPDQLLSLLEVAVKLCESGPGDNSIQSHHGRQC